MIKKDYPTEALSELYGKRVREYGMSPQALFWRDKEQQILRLRVLADINPRWGRETVLDVGCGFCDLIEVLRDRGFTGRYVGVDVVEDIVQMARKRFPDLEILQRDILRNPFGEKFDYVFASGTFNLRFCQDMRTYVATMLDAMFEHCRVGVAVNYLSTYVDYQHELAHHTDPCWVFDYTKRLTRRVVLRHDYMPYEFTLYLYKDDSIAPGNVFSAYVKS